VRRSAWVPAAAFLLGIALHWPSTLWFRDEAGYVGQARLLLDGRLRPDRASVVHAWDTPRGPIAEYPFAFPALIALPFAVTPRGVFAVAAGTALLLGWATSRKLEAWGGREPAWGFALLLLPPVLLFSRTAMADVPLAALSMLAWVAPSFGAFAALTLIKPIGILVAVGLIVGDLAAGRPAKALAPALLGASAGIAATLALNYAATGSIAYAYVRSESGFGAKFLATSGLAHLKTLLLVPPGLMLGAIPLWRRREFGALGACGLVVVAMSCFSFVDAGRGAIESLIVAPRLILPAVVLLGVGWIDGIARFVPARAVRWCVAALLFAGAFATGAVLEARARPRHDALAAAEAALTERGGGVLGLGDAAFEAGLLSRYPVVWAEPGAIDVPVVLCASTVESFRAPSASVSCALAGYEEIHRIDPYRVLVRSQGTR